MKFNFKVSYRCNNNIQINKCSETTWSVVYFCYSSYRGCLSTDLFKFHEINGINPYKMLVSLIYHKLRGFLQSTRNRRRHGKGAHPAPRRKISDTQGMRTNEGVILHEYVFDWHIFHWNFTK